MQTKTLEQRIRSVIIPPPKERESVTQRRISKSIDWYAYTFRNSPAMLVPEFYGKAVMIMVDYMLGKKE